MALNDLLAHVLSAIKNAESRSKSEVVYRPKSKLVIEVAKILKANNYIGDFEITEDLRGGSITFKLNGKINKIGVIKPRFSVNIDEIERYEKRYLPAKDFGLLIISTPKGLMTHNDAMKNNHGGVLVAYVY